MKDPLVAPHELQGEFVRAYMVAHWKAEAERLEAERGDKPFAYLKEEERDAICSMMAEAMNLYEEMGCFDKS